MVQEPIFIVDIGSSSVKAGYSGEDTPSYIFPSISSIDYPKYTESIEQYNELTHPVHRGQIKDWDQMEQLWTNLSENVGAATGDISILLIESQRSTHLDRQKWAEMLFDKFRYPSICICNSAALSVFASGRTTGLAVECGAGITSTVPVFEGLMLSHAAISMEYGGQDISANLKKRFLDRRIKIDMESTKTVKERLAYANHHCNSSRDGEQSTTFSLPDGTDVTVENSILSSCTDPLFINSSISSGGLIGQTYESIALCDDSVKSDLANNIIISGGTSMLPGLGDRLNDDLIAKIATEAEYGRCSISSNLVRVIPHTKHSERGYTSQRKHAAWTGGSIFSSFGTYHKHLKITKQEWEENPDAMLSIKSL